MSDNANAAKMNDESNPRHSGKNIRDFSKQSSDYASEVKDSSAAPASDLKSRTEQSLRKVGQQFETTYETSKEAIKHASDSTAAWVKKNPVPAALIFAGAGLVVGMAARRLISKNL